MAQCPSILTEVSGYHTGGVIWRKPLSLLLKHTYLEVVGSTPVTGENFFGKKNKLLTWRDDINVHADFPITLLSHTTCSLLPRTFLPLLLLGLEILSKLLTITRTHTGFPIFLFYPSIHKLCLGNFPARACFVDTKNSILKKSICNYSLCSALFILWCFGVLGRW